MGGGGGKGVNIGDFTMFGQGDASCEPSLDICFTNEIILLSRLRTLFPSTRLGRQTNRRRRPKRLNILQSQLSTLAWKNQLDTLVEYARE